MGADEILTTNTAHLGPFIAPFEGDASVETKLKTVIGEGIDVSQFALMTAFGDGLDAIAEYIYGIKNFLPAPSIAGLDTISYAAMIWLAHVRTEKYKQRHAQFTEQNTQAPDHDYYSLEAKALLAAMTPKLLAKLALLRKGNSSYEEGIIEILKHNTTYVNSAALTTGKSTVDTWHRLFIELRKTPQYNAVRYKLDDNLKNAIGVHHDAVMEAISSKGENASYTIENILQEYIVLLLKQKNSIIEKEKVASLITELTLIEKHWKKTKNVSDKYFEEQRLEALFTNHLEIYGLDSTTLGNIKAIYNYYHQNQDKNDKAFYKANERGILQYEKNRTRQKIKIFSSVRLAAAVSTPITLGLFIASFFNPITALLCVIPLFIVGSTSLVDEATDIQFKYWKWRQSVDAFDEWKRENKFNDPNVSTAIIALSNERKEKNTVPALLKGHTPEEIEYLYRLHTKKDKSEIRERLVPDDLKKARSLFSKPNALSAAEGFFKRRAQKTQLTKVALLEFINSNSQKIDEFAEFSNKKNQRDYMHYGKLYLEFKCNEYDQYHARQHRRAIKMTQSLFSFNGVFWGVLASMAASTLIVSNATPASYLHAASLGFLLTGSSVMETLNFIGFATIAIAAVASAIMITYQINQNKVKGLQKNDEHYKEMNRLLAKTSSSTGKKVQFSVEKSNYKFMNENEFNTQLSEAHPLKEFELSPKKPIPKSQKAKLANN